MENKLQQLTQKLYEEGLEKGRSEAEKCVAEAQEKAAKIIADARKEAEEIIRKAENKAEDVAKNTATEISLARLKAEIASLITAKSTSEGVKAAAMDGAFIKEMLLSVAKNWNGASAGKVELKALLPEAKRAELDASFEQAAKELLKEGIEVGYSKEVKSGFRISEKDGGYYISFADADLEALVSEYLREKVSNMLFGA